VIRQRTRTEKAARQARREDRATTLRALGDVSAWLAAPKAKARRTPIGRRQTARRSSYFRDDAYLDSLRVLPWCAIARYFGLDPASCSPVMEANHPREGAGFGQRRPDPLAYNGCHTCHRRRHAKTGEWAGLSLHDVRRAERLMAYEPQRLHYGRLLLDADLPTVRAAVEAGASTYQLFSTASEAA
jgi:hypothetical protein